MKRLVTAGLLGLTAVGCLFAVAAVAAPDIQQVVTPQLVTPLTADQQRDWDCLDAAIQDWGLHPTGAGAASPDALQAMRTYYLGRLSVELGDERLARYLHDARTQPARSAGWGGGAALCQARMARSLAAVKPMESRNFSLQDAASDR